MSMAMRGSLLEDWWSTDAVVRGRHNAGGTVARLQRSLKKIHPEQTSPTTTVETAMTVRLLVTNVSRLCLHGAPPVRRAGRVRICWQPSSTRLLPAPYAQSVETWAQEDDRASTGAMI
jgi:hypothetical protein